MALSDSSGTSEAISAWGELHHVRTVLAIISFAICVVSVVLDA